MLVLVLVDNKTGGGYAVLASAIACNWNAEWRLRAGPYNLRTFCLWVLLYWLICFAGLSYNVQISVNGKLVTLAGAFSEFGIEWLKWQWEAEEEGESFSESTWQEFYEFLSHFMDTHTLASPSEMNNAYKVGSIKRLLVRLSSGKCNLENVYIGKTRTRTDNIPTYYRGSRVVERSKT